MKIEILRVTPEGFKREEYKINGVKGSADLLAIDIEGIGWRAIELKTISSYTIA